LIFGKKSDRAGSGQAKVGSGQFIYCVFFRSSIDFDLIEGHLISARIGWVRSDQIRIELDQFEF
jgi:hypothetical protein